LVEERCERGFVRDGLHDLLDLLLLVLYLLLLVSSGEGSSFGLSGSRLLFLLLLLGLAAQVSVDLLCQLLR
jgi:hypothetical protein